jgi:hypothetical protein
MAEAMSSILRFPVLLLVGLFGLSSTSLAHRLDEYLQATLVTIEPGEIRLQISLSPGVAVAEKVLSRIDRNGDSVISTNEATAYSTLLMRDLSLRLDQRNLELKLSSSNFPAPTELRTGLGIIQIELSAIIGSLPAGPHEVLLENRHLRTLSVYLFNATQPSSASVHIIRQKRNQTQSTGEIEFTVD